MSTASRGSVYKHFQRALARWPKDPLRPDCQLQDVLARRLEKQYQITSTPASPTKAPAAASPAVQDTTEAAAATPVFTEEYQRGQVNALYSLLDDRYLNRYRPQGNLYEPRSNPTYYKDLLTELEEAPHRTWLQRVAKRLGGMVRLS